MSERTDGGPAFPVPNDAAVNGQPGMTLRDYFAGNAMDRIQIAQWIGGLRDVDTQTMNRAAVMAYAYADAMLKAREQ